MRFIVVRKRKSLEIIRQEEIIPSHYPSLEDLGNAVAEKVMLYEKLYPYPEHEVLSGTADTLEDFLQDLP